MQIDYYLNNQDARWPENSQQEAFRRLLPERIDVENKLTGRPPTLAGPLERARFACPKKKVKLLQTYSISYFYHMI